MSVNIYDDTQGTLTRCDGSPNVVYGAGSYDLNKSILAGYTTGSGNYMYVFIPGRFSPSSTVTISVLGAQIQMADGTLSQSDIDSTYTPDIDITPFGIRVCFKFNTTQVIYKPLTANFQATLTIA